MLSLIAFSQYIKIMTAMSITFCTHVDDRRHLNYCVSEMMECVLDGETIEWCGGSYIEDMESWKK